MKPARQRERFSFDMVEPARRTPLVLWVLWMSDEIFDALDAVIDKSFTRSYVPVVHCHVAECVSAILETLKRIVEIDKEKLNISGFRSSAKTTATTTTTILDDIKILLEDYAQLGPDPFDIITAKKGCRLRGRVHIYGDELKALPEIPRRRWFAPRSMVGSGSFCACFFDSKNSERELTVLYYIFTLFFGEQNKSSTDAISGDLIMTPEIAQKLAAEYNISNPEYLNNIVAHILGGVIAGWIRGLTFYYMSVASACLTEKAKLPKYTKYIEDAENLIENTCRRYSALLLDNNAAMTRNCLWKLFAAYDCLVDYIPYSIRTHREPGLPFGEVSPLTVALKDDTRNEYCTLVGIDSLPLENPLSSNANESVQAKLPARYKPSRFVANFESCEAGKNALRLDNISKNNVFIEWASGRISSANKRQQTGVDYRCSCNDSKRLINDSNNQAEAGFPHMRVAEFNIETYMKILQEELQKETPTPWFVDEFIAYTAVPKKFLKEHIERLVLLSGSNISKKLLDFIKDESGCNTLLDNIPENAYGDEKTATALEQNCSACTDRLELIKSLRVIVNKRILRAKAELEETRSKFAQDIQQWSAYSQKMQSDYEAKCAELHKMAQQFQQQQQQLQQQQQPLQRPQQGVYFGPVSGMIAPQQEQQPLFSFDSPQACNDNNAAWSPTISAPFSLTADGYNN